MANSPDHDLEEMIHALNPVVEAYAEGSREKEATMLAQIALLYIRELGKEEEFIQRYKWGRSTTFTVEVSHEFPTREEAEQWLALGKAQHKERVKIAGKGFMVVQLPGRQTLIDMPLPEELNSAEWADEPK